MATGRLAVIAIVAGLCGVVRSNARATEIGSTRSMGRVRCLGCRSAGFDLRRGQPEAERAPRARYGTRVQRRGPDWVAAATLSVPHATMEDPFGVSMATDEKTLIVGAQFADVHGEDSGLAYVFERRNQNWQQSAVLSATDAEAGDQFGLTVSVSGETVVAGARLAGGFGENAGAAYVFERRAGGWQQAAKLTASDPIAGDLFGRASLVRAA